MPLVISYRKRGLRSSMSASERAKVIKMKAQIEQQIQALEEQINLEKIALTASNRPDRPLVKTVRYKDVFILIAYPYKTDHGSWPWNDYWRVTFDKIAIFWWDGIELIMDLFLLCLFSSSSINKMGSQRERVPDLQSSLSESDRLMIEACQFSKFTREHPLDKWTVGSLPDLTLYW